MDSNQQFWVRIWTLAAVVAVASLTSCSYLSTITKKNWDHAVANGADPMVVSCALGVGGTNSSHADAIMCNTLAQNRK